MHDNNRSKIRDHRRQHRSGSASPEVAETNNRKKKTSSAVVGNGWVGCCDAGGDGCGV